MPQAPLKPKGGAIKKKIKVVRNAGVTRRGARTVPRRGKMADNEKTQKKLSAQLAASTEQRLAARAGHMELLSGGKNDKKKEAPKK